jgi:FtsH-binding integral membrane protein
MAFERIENGIDLVEAARRDFVTRVYGWMAAGLGLTAVVAWGVAGSPAAIDAIYRNAGGAIVLMLVECALVYALSGWATRMSAGLAMALFTAYAALNGVTLSWIFLAYTRESIASTFIVTGATFGAMSVYGAATRRDLSSLGSMCFMALLGLIVASIVNLFLASSQLQWALTYVGILVFVGLTAYDTQKIVGMAGAGAGEGAAIAGALALYLDFVNLFIQLLRIVGKRR